jgi:hypothetical protein
MRKLKNIIIVIAVIVFFAVAIYFRIEGMRNTSTVYAKRLSLDKFFVSNGCQLESNMLESTRYKAIYFCRDFNAYRYYDTKGNSYLIVKYKSPVTTSRITDLFNGPYYGSIFKELFNCSVSASSSGDLITVSAGNCTYDIQREVTFKKSDEYTIQAVGSTRLINLNKTTKEDLVLIAKGLYEKLLNNYIDLNVPPEYLPDACKINIVESANMISVNVCGDALVFWVVVNPYGLSQYGFPHNFERFFE